MELDFQGRGAPHYHIRVHIPGKYTIYYIREWLFKNRYEVVQRYWYEKDEKHRKVGIGYDPIDSFLKAGFYVAKYIN